MKNKWCENNKMSWMRILQCWNGKDWMSIDLVCYIIESLLQYIIKHFYKVSRFNIW